MGCRVVSFSSQHRVPALVDVVQGAGGGLPAVGESEVDGNSQVDLAASHNVLEERAALLEADLEHIQVMLSIV